MKKILILITLILCFGNVNAEISATTKQLMFSDSVSHMTLGILLCEMTGDMKEKDKYGCSYTSSNDRLTIYYKSSIVRDQFGSVITDNVRACEWQLGKKFGFLQSAHSRKALINSSIATYLLKSNEFLKGFYEHGIIRNTNGKSRTLEMNQWMANHLDIKIFIGIADLDSEVAGISCTMQLYKDRYTSIRKTTYSNFLQNL